MYVITITEIVPGESGREVINTYHKVVNDLEEAAKGVETFWLNFGVLVSITIVPAG